MTIAQGKYALANTLGTLGYLSIILQWTWCLITLGNPILTAKNPLFIPQAPIPDAQPAIDFGIFAPFIPFIALIIVAVLLFLTVFTLVRIPKTVGEKGAQATHVIAERIVKQTAKHRPLPAKKRKRLAAWIVWLLKALAVYIPLALVFITPGVEELTTQLITAIGFMGAAFSTGYFLLQLLLSLTLKLDPKKIW